jgi:hypothetical protein
MSVYTVEKFGIGHHPVHRVCELCMLPGGSPSCIWADIAFRNKKGDTKEGVMRYGFHVHASSALALPSVCPGSLREVCFFSFSWFSCHCVGVCLFTGASRLSGPTIIVLPMLL